MDTFEGKAIAHPALLWSPLVLPLTWTCPRPEGKVALAAAHGGQHPWAQSRVRKGRNHQCNPFTPVSSKLKLGVCPSVCKFNLVDSVQIIRDLYSPVGPPTPPMIRIHLLNMKFGRKGRSTFFVIRTPSGGFQLISISEEKAMKQFCIYFKNLKR